MGDALGDGRVAGILVTTFVLRAVLIPLLAPMAVKTRDRQRIVRRIRPQIKALDQQYKDDPSTLTKKLKELHAEHGISIVDGPGLISAFIQLPILIALFQAVLEVWPADALSLTALALSIPAAGLSLIGVRASGQAEGAKWMLWLSAVLPILICLWLGVGVALYLFGFYGAGALQPLFMRSDADAGRTPEGA